MRYASIYIHIYIVDTFVIYEKYPSSWKANLSVPIRVSWDQDQDRDRNKNKSMRKQESLKERKKYRGRSWGERDLFGIKNSSAGIILKLHFDKVVSTLSGTFAVLAYNDRYTRTRAGTSSAQFL